MNKLKFRRQFLVTHEQCDELSDWQTSNLGKYKIYVHQDCELTTFSSSLYELALIGYAIDPYHPEKSNQDILANLSGSASVAEIGEKLFHVGGRFVLLIKKSENYYVFHDPCGLKSVFYTNFEGKTYLASQPLLFKLQLPITKGKRYDSYFKSGYVKYEVEHWIPSGTSLFEEVHQLVPNYYLDINQQEQIRFWPIRNVKKISLDEAVKKIAFLLNQSLIAAHKRYKMALSLTAGWDSRTVLSASKSIAKDLYFYTLQYRDLTYSSNDIKIPWEVLAKIGYDYQVVDCRKPMDGEFRKIYESNSDMPHLFDWGLIANGMFLGGYPQERMAVKGSCAEVGRCFFYKYGRHKKITSPNHILELVPGWKDIPFIKERITQWFNEVTHLPITGVNLLDLFYWEHRMGGWQSQSQLEWDTIQEALTPFNHRELLETMLGVDVNYRKEPDYLLFKNLIKHQWEDLLVAPINPRSDKEQMMEVLKEFLKQMGVFSAIKESVKKLKSKKPTHM